MNAVSVNSSKSKSGKARSFKWWHAVVIFVVANLMSAAPAGYNGSEVFYSNFILPKVAPPGWAFAPAWLFNNITSLAALYIIANMPRHKIKGVFYWAEGASWLFFAIFSILYFGLKSPILGGVDTVLGLFATSISLYVSFKINRKASLLILPRFLWLLLASYVSVYTALMNRDVLFEVGPLLGN